VLVLHCASGPAGRPAAAKWFSITPRRKSRWLSVDPRTAGERCSTVAICRCRGLRERRPHQRHGEQVDNARLSAHAVPPGYNRIDTELEAFRDDRVQRALISFSSSSSARSSDRDFLSWIVARSASALPTRRRQQRD